MPAWLTAHQTATGVQTDELPGNSGESWVGTEYTKRGTVKRVTSSYGDSDGVLVSSVTRDADGVVKQIVYGDAASTTTDFTHDTRRRVRTVQTHRTAPGIWSSPPSGYTAAMDPTTSYQLVLQDDELTYDAVDNPIHIRDWRNPAEWPVGSKPASRSMQYDDLNRVTRIDYQYHGGSSGTGDDEWISPFDKENTDGITDTRRGMPSPHVSFGKRVLTQTMQYDWLGNQTFTDDDAHGFYDRSLGTVTNNTSAGKPYQLASAAQTTGTKTGSLETEYDAAGNLVDMAVLRDGDCLPTGATCSQRFVYDWDEVGRLVRARRWDVASPSVSDAISSGTPDADLRHSYDASDNRVIKTAVDSASEESHTVYIFGTLELRRAGFDTMGSPDDYDDNIDTEVGYLFGHGVRLARLHWNASGTPEIGGSHLHVLFLLGDHLGSSSKVLDKATGELVEASTYMGYGQSESDYRPGRWKGYREDYRFTGKEEDSEVGLTYFGKRFLSSQLGRWVSGDPLTVHTMGADANVYAYVSGKLLRGVDQAGLSELNDERNAPREIGPTGAEWDIRSVPVLGRVVSAFETLGSAIISGSRSFGHMIYEKGAFFGTLAGLGLFLRSVVIGIGVASLTLTPLETPGRTLTQQERAIVKEVFGNSVSLALMRVRDADNSWSGFFSGHWSLLSWLNSGKGEASTLDQTIWMNNSELDVRNLSRDGTFVHEVVHVWQNQHGDMNSYAYRDRTKNESYGWSAYGYRPWSTLGAEEQAQLVQDEYARSEAARTRDRALQNLLRQPGLTEVEFEQGMKLVEDIPSRDEKIQGMVDEAMSSLRSGTGAPK